MSSLPIKCSTTHLHFERGGRADSHAVQNTAVQALQHKIAIAFGTIENEVAQNSCGSGGEGAGADEVSAMEGSGETTPQRHKNARSTH